MTSKEHWYIRLVFVLAAVLTLLLPVNATQTRNFPKAEAEYIRRVFADHTVGQSFTTRLPSDSIEVLTRGNTTNQAVLVAIDATGTEIGKARFVVTPEDRWIAVPFYERLGAGKHVITFKTGPEVVQDDAVLLRYQPLSSSYENGNMIVDGTDSYGDLAFRVKSRLPFWQSLLVGRNAGKSSLWNGFLLILVGIVVGILLWILRLLVPDVGRPAVINTALVFLIIVSIFIRLPVLEELEGVFGGDVFNYLSKAQAPLLGADPFAADPRKGPLFSVFLMPGFSTADPVLWARWMSLLSAAVTTVLLVGVARCFKLPWGLAVGAGLLLAVNQDFIWESVNGLANTFYVAVIVAALLLYLLAEKKWAQWLLAVMCGLIFLTRFEGGTFAVILLGALWWRERLPWKRIVALAVVAAVIMLIPQVSFFWSGGSGIRSIDDVSSDTGLFVVRSFDDLVNNLGRFYRFLYSAWLLPKMGAGKSIVLAFIIGVVGGTFTSWSRIKWPKVSLRYRLMVGGLLLLGVIMLILINGSAAREYLVALPWLLIGLGVVPWWRSRPFDATVVFVSLLIQAVIILFILPKPRYFLPLVPYFSLLMVFGVYTLLRWKDNRYVRVVPLVIVGILASLFYVDGRYTVQDRLEHHNLKAEALTPMVEAMKYLRGQEKRVGLRVGLEQSVTTYLLDELRYPFEQKEAGKAAVAREELAWINEHKLSFLVERNDESVWQSVRSYPNLFELRHAYDTDYGDSQVMVYEVNLGKVREFLGMDNNENF